MVKIELKGEVIELLPVIEIGEKKTKKMSFIFKVPGAFYDFEQQWEYWKIDIYKEDKINTFQKLFKGSGDEVFGTITAALSSNHVIKINKDDMYITNITMINFTLKP